MTATRIGRVVVGVTGTLANLTALHLAVAQARRADARLVAVHVSPQPEPDVLEQAFVDGFGGPPPGIALRCVNLDGRRPGPALVAAADGRNDLLVVGSRLGLFGGVRLGPVSRYCFAHAGCPVLVTPPPDLLRELRSLRVPRPVQRRRPVNETVTQTR